MEKYEGHPASDEGRSEVEVNTYRFLDALGVDYVTACHEAAFTMEQCAKIESGLGAAICKNLFLTNRQQTQFYLLMLPGDKVFKTKYLSSQLGCARLSFAQEEQMVALLGIHPGAVSPMGLVNDSEKRVVLVIDHDLLAWECVGCHPCVNTATVKLKIDDLLNRFVPATNHTYTVVDLPSE
jgi:Ala-tRNA(Pro) deacylase